MKLAKDSHLKLERFFREYFNNSQIRLPPVYFHAGRFSEILTRALKIYAITIGRNIFVAPKFVSLSEEKLLKARVEIAAHEITHVLQFRREGFARFFYKYLSSYGKNLRSQKSWNAAARQRAYLDIPFEIEARSAAARFVEWNRNIKN